MNHSTEDEHPTEELSENEQVWKNESESGQWREYCERMGYEHD